MFRGDQEVLLSDGNRSGAPDCRFYRGQLLRDEVMEELFEEQYGQSDNDEFFNLVDAFTSDRNDDALQNIVRSLYDFSQSNPDPDRWLNDAASMYELADDDGIDDLSFIDSLKFDIGLQLDTARDLLERSLALTKVPGGLHQGLRTI